MPETPTLLTVRQTATLLHVTPTTIRRWIAAGTIPALRIGRDWRINPIDIQGATHENTTRRA